MIKKAYIRELAAKHLEGTDKYVTDVIVKAGNVITIVIDGDSAVLIDDCSHLSKAVESSLDRDAEDFELRVTSYGADKPLIHRRQYTKNIGRELQVLTSDEQKIKGKLVKVNEENITLELPPDKKKKETQPSEITLSFSGIVQAKVVLSFK